jgi:hypothetical protein
MRWLPARAYDNNLFVVFTNPIGMVRYLLALPLSSLALVFASIA